MSARWPAIFEYVTSTRFEGGAARQTSTVMLLWEEGLFKACLHDREESCSCWISSETLCGVLDALEAAVASGEADWRRKPKGQQQGRGK